MGYYIDLEAITLDDYKKQLSSAYLPPSRMLLKDNIEELFECLKRRDIHNVNQLLNTLKKKGTIEEFAKEECLSVEYLKVLLREVKSTLPKPNKFADFACLSKETVQKLEAVKITKTDKLYDSVITEADRITLAEQTGILQEDILQLTKLTDLSRIKWVGVTYAQILFDIGVDTVEKVSKQEAESLHERINTHIKENDIYKGSIGLNDVNILIEIAGEMPFEIEY